MHHVTVTISAQKAALCALPSVHKSLRQQHHAGLLPPWRARELPAHVVYPVQKGLPLRVRALVDFMTEHVKELLARPWVCPGAGSNQSKG